MPNEWLFSLIGGSSHVFNIASTLLIKISKIYIIDSSNEQYNELRHKRSLPPRL
jgi:hypothetical protein